ncbi:MAG: hypothetical protein HKP30_00540 [Myxococcales bacterium]|nr:hypothetical protein [Myxococcales bacterium]
MAAAPRVFTGTYRVSGQTVEEASGRSRDISGTIVLSQDGDAYTASFELATLFPTAEGASEAQIVGTGEGMLEGDQLLGTAETQIILAQVPGVDAEFAFLPRQYGPRITSRSVAELDEEGALTIEIKSEAAAGESYRSTRTTVRGARIED